MVLKENGEDKMVRENIGINGIRYIKIWYIKNCKKMAIIKKKTACPNCFYAETSVSAGK